MKNIFLVLLTIVWFPVAASAQPKRAGIPAAVRAAFAKQFPGIIPHWQKESAKYEANFKRGSHDESVLFAADGTMLEQEIEIQVTKLPVLAISYVKKRYPRAGIKEAAKITKANGEINYEAGVKGRDLIFDNAGNFLRIAKE
jgi:hypothetical protein